LKIDFDAKRDEQLSVEILNCMYWPMFTYWMINKSYDYLGFQMDSLVAKTKKQS